MGRGNFPEDFWGLWAIIVGVIFGTVSRTAGVTFAIYFNSALYLSGTNEAIKKDYILSIPTSGSNQCTYLNSQACTHT